MALGANYAQTTRVAHFNTFAFGNGLRPIFSFLNLFRCCFVYFIAKLFCQESLRHDIGITAKQNVRTTTSHVRCNGNCARTASLSNNCCFSFMILSV